MTPQAPTLAESRPEKGTARRSAYLKWLDPNLPPANSFTVYRGDGECDPYKVLPVLRVGVKISPYEDMTIRNGRTYCYAVSATYKGIESAQSNMVTAIVPKGKE